MTNSTIKVNRDIMNIFDRKPGITIDSVARTSIDLANEKKTIWSFTKNEKKISEVLPG